MPELTLLTSTYDRTHYPHRSFVQCHPDRLAIVAMLAGVDTADIRTARVLEIGCGTGGNLLPMAVQLPRARFTGIDLSSSQIQRARDIASACSITNVELVPTSIEAFDADDGSFDYVLCHGVFSWVGHDTQQAILRSISRLLRPSGAAFVSHNTLPGWRDRQIVRDLALRVLDTADFSAELADAEQLRDLLIEELSRLIASVGDGDPQYRSRLMAELARLNEVDAAYVVHEHFAPVSNPCSVARFARMAEAHGLCFVGDANPHLFAVSAAAPSDLRGSLAERISAHEWFDLVHLTSFRQSVLVRSDARCAGSVEPTKVLERVTVASSLIPPDDINLSQPSSSLFQSARGVVTFVEPIVKAAFIELFLAAPRALFVSELLARARTRLGRVEPSDESTLVDELLALVHETDLIGFTRTKVLREPVGARLSVRAPVHALAVRAWSSTDESLAS
ncbi:MAG: class I SAM-dependent methyltransferase [Polyangiaceae bacterium]